MTLRGNNIKLSNFLPIRQKSYIDHTIIKSIILNNLWILLYKDTKIIQNIFKNTILSYDYQFVSLYIETFWILSYSHRTLFILYILIMPKSLAAYRSHLSTSIKEFEVYNFLFL